jgi:hypothetical protein
LRKGFRIEKGRRLASTGLQIKTTFGKASHQLSDGSLCLSYGRLLLSRLHPSGDLSVLLGYFGEASLLLGAGCSFCGSLLRTETPSLKNGGWSRDSRTGNRADSRGKTYVV